MISYSEDEKRKIIMDYYLNKRNRIDEINEDEYKKEYIHSSSCVDEMYLYFNANEIKMKSQGCAVFLAASEIFVERLIKIGFDKKDLLIELFDKLVNKRNLTTQEKEILEKLNIFENVSKHLNRKECALLITQIIKKINL